jgi:hypothetical protein
MAFMIPQYTNEDFVFMNNGPFEDLIVPAYIEADMIKDGYTTAERYSGKFFCRLSAPGYMDCTDWSGPFDSIQEARDHIEQTYDVDADTGEDLTA